MGRGRSRLGVNLFKAFHLNMYAAVETLDSCLCGCMYPHLYLLATGMLYRDAQPGALPSTMQVRTEAALRQKSGFPTAKLRTSS